MGKVVDGGGEGAAEVTGIESSGRLPWRKATLARRDIPDAVVSRLPGYLQVLTDLAAAGERTIPSAELAVRSGVGPATLRKDLAHLGSTGTRGVGYQVDPLIATLRDCLGLNRPWRVVIIGAGHLGRALAAYPGFTERGFSLAGIVDVDAAAIGTRVGGVTIRHTDDLAELIADPPSTMAVIAVPALAAQRAADQAIALGVTGILNFAPVVLNVPASVEVRNVDLSTELQILAFHAGQPPADEHQEVS